MIYRIGTIPPFRGGFVEDRLAAFNITYLYPKQLVEVRIGRRRVRELKPRPILPGLIFVDEVQADESMVVLRERGVSIWWLRNHLADDAPARCTDQDVAPLLQWIEAENSRFFADDGADLQAELPLFVRHLPGTMVMISNGPFQGMLATIVRDDGKVAQIDLATGRFSMQIPSCNLRLPGV
jgi:transcription antitermination factor NusG